MDPGLRRTGWGLISCAKNRKPKYIASGVIVPNAKEDDALRLDFIFSELTRLVGETRPHAIAVETVFVNKNPRTSLLLGQARGVALLAAARAGHRPRSFAPIEVKRAVTGDTFAPKEQVAEEVHRLLPAARRETRSDALDALAVAICCLRAPAAGDVPAKKKKRKRKAKTAKVKTKTAPKTGAVKVKGKTKTTTKAPSKVVKVKGTTTTKAPSKVVKVKGTTTTKAPLKVVKGGTKTVTKAPSKVVKVKGTTTTKAPSRVVKVGTKTKTTAKASPKRRRRSPSAVR